MKFFQIFICTTNPASPYPSASLLSVCSAADTGSPDFSLLPGSFSLSLHSFSSAEVSWKAVGSCLFFRFDCPCFPFDPPHLPFCLWPPGLFSLRRFSGLAYLAALFVLFVLSPVDLFSAAPSFAALLAPFLYSPGFVFESLFFL